MEKREFSGLFALKTKEEKSKEEKNVTFESVRYLYSAM